MYIPCLKEPGSTRVFCFPEVNDTQAGKSLSRNPGARHCHDRVEFGAAKSAVIASRRGNRNERTGSSDGTTASQITRKQNGDWIRRDTIKSGLIRVMTNKPSHVTLTVRAETTDPA